MEQKGKHSLNMHGWKAHFIHQTCHLGDLCPVAPQGQENCYVVYHKGSLSPLLNLSAFFSQKSCFQLWSIYPTKDKQENININTTEITCCTYVSMFIFMKLLHSESFMLSSSLYLSISKSFFISER